jgi:hypothetical protein
MSKFVTVAKSSDEETICEGRSTTGSVTLSFMNTLGCIAEQLTLPSPIVGFEGCKFNHYSLLWHAKKEEWKLMGNSKQWTKEG